MKKCLLLLLIVPCSLSAQTVFPFMDFNNFFKAFRDGYFIQIEHQPVTDVTIGDEMVAYVNSQKDFKVYDGTKTQLLTNQIVQFKMSDHMLAWNLGPIINYYEDGKPRALTSFGGNYEVMDSLLVYQDTRYNTVNAVYRGKTTMLYQLTGDLYMPEAIGDNIIAFRDNGDLFKVFWRGEIYELGVVTGNYSISFTAGTDMVAFNDPTTRTFAVFENGEFKDVENMFVNKMKVGRGFVVYEDVQGNLKYYGNGEKKELSSFFQFWDAKDDVAMWGESNSTYAMINGERSQVCNYITKEWLIKNDVIAFRSNLGGVAAFVNGNLKGITNLPNTEYTINKHSVFVTLSNRSVIALFKGQIYKDL